MKENNNEYISINKKYPSNIERMRNLNKKGFNIMLGLGEASIGIELLYGYLINELNATNTLVTLLLALPVVGSCCYFKMSDNKYTKLQELNEYKECTELYDKFVTSIANLFEKLQIKNPLEIAVLYNYILEKGYLSKDSKYKYHIFKNEDELYHELLGTRITTGYGVCRHNASLLTDILNKMGNIAATVPVLSSKESDFIQKTANINNDQIDGNHCITGMLVDDKKVTYDPTHRRIGIFAPHKIQNLVINSPFFALGKGQLKEYPRLAYVLDKSKIVNYYAYPNPDNLEKILNSEPLILSDDEILNIFNNALDRIENADLSEFYNEQKDIIERLAELNNIIMPHSDEKLKQKQLR